jgi:hypothetical protein
MLTPEALADLLMIPVPTLYSWNYRGVGPPVHKIGRHLRYRLTDVEEWIDLQGIRRQ